MKTFDEIFAGTTHADGEVVTAKQVAAMLGVAGGFFRILGTSATRMTQVLSLGNQRGSQTWTSPPGMSGCAVFPHSVAFVPNPRY